ncbi:hypothetical protein BDV18DRAFT_146521 [Aspergillus unguis]
MDPNPSASRDPRLQNRPNRPPLQSRLSQHETQQQSPARTRQSPAAASPNDASGDLFIRGIAELVQKAVSAALKTNEKDKIRKKREGTNDLLHKAKSHSGFPSTVEFYQHYQDQESASLAVRDEEIKKHEIDFQRSLDDLKNKWAVSVNCSSTSPEIVARLQNDLKTANARISDLQQDIEHLSKKASTNNADIKSLQSIQGMQNKSFENHTESLAKMRKEVAGSSARLKTLEDKQIRPLDGLNSDSKRVMDEIRLKFENLEQKTAVLSQNVAAVTSSYQKLSGLPDKVKQSLKDQDQKLDQIVNKKVHGYAPNSSLDSAVRLLDEKFKELSELQEFKDMTLFSQIEELREICSLKSSEVDELKQQLAESQQFCHKLSDTLKQTLSRLPKEALDARVDNLFAEVKKGHAQLESFSMALLSLESRYNNMTTEPIVQHMVGAIHEMYPSLDRILSELSAHKRTIDEAIPVLQKKIEQLETQDHASIPREELDSLKANQNNLSQSIGELLQRYQWLSQDEFSRMQTTVKSLEEQQSSTNNAILQRQTAEKEFGEKLLVAGESLDNRLQNLSDALERLDSEYNQDKQDRSVAVTDQDMYALQDRIKVLEESTKQGYDKLKEQFDRLKRTTQPPESPLKQPPPRPDLVEGSLGMRIKRRHSESADERSPAPSNSPHSPDSTSSPAVISAESRRKKRKKKKREGRFRDENPIQLDD